MIINTYLTFFINNIVIIRYTVNKHNSKSKGIRIKEKWQNILETNKEIVWKNIFSNIYSSTNERKLRRFQYKFIHRILPFNRYFLTWNLSQTSLCDFCEYRKETVDNLFWDCHITQTLWNNLDVFLKPNALRLTLNLKTISLGIAENIPNRNILIFLIVLMKTFMLKTKI